ncbi:MAG: recombination protein U [Bacilli bacterium]|nr:recombination protein U [Bacilli bacterium]MBO6285410.1 recombination protein U [Bacilli bacterium]
MSEIHYPGGVRPVAEFTSKTQPKKKMTMKISPGNRGMDFEAEINQTNDYYKEKDLAVFSKRPTPINIVKVDYSRGAKITEAYFETQSTTDYNGVYKGHYVDFEAKSVHGKTSFPLANIPRQQIEHLKYVLHHGGIGFFLIRFVTKEETFLVPASYVIDFYEKRERASIPLEDIRANGYLIPVGYRPRYDFLPLIDEAFLK